jgi:carbohydrate-binding DOMON domain-containing protein
VFDLLRLEVYVDEYNVYFKVVFKNLGGNPWNGSNGFCLQHIQIYILTTSQITPNNTAPGVNMHVYPGWHYLIVGVGGWNNTYEQGPWPVGSNPAIYSATGELIATKGVLFDVYAIPGEDAVEFKVSKTILVDVENILNWKFQVVIAGHDGLTSRDKIREVYPGEPSKWFFGGADPVASTLGVQPKVVDLLAPTPRDQYSMLSSYDLVNVRPAVVYMAGYVLIPPLRTAPTIFTTTIIKSFTVTVTKTTGILTYTTIPTSVIETREVTTTKTLIISKGEIETTTMTVKIPDYTTTKIIGVVSVVTIALLLIMLLRIKHSVE